MYYFVDKHLDNFIRRDRVV